MSLHWVVYLVSWITTFHIANASPAQGLVSIVGQSLTLSTPTATLLTSSNPTTSTSPQPTYFMTTVTYPFGGPTVVLATRSTSLPSSASDTATLCTTGCIPTIYTTNFVGLTTITTTSVTRFVETTQLDNGQFSIFPSTRSSVITQAYSGVRGLSMSTFLVGSTVTTTATAVLNGALTTYTATSINVATTTSAVPVTNAAPTQAPDMRRVAALLAAGAAVAIL